MATSAKYLPIFTRQLERDAGVRLAIWGVTVRGLWFSRLS
jgi:hypothetical protein